MTQEMTRDQMLALLAQMQAENATLKAAVSTGSGCKVSEKGALSVYGIGRFPVTLYRGQWEALFTRIDSIKAFIAANSDKLSAKA